MDAKGMMAEALLARDDAPLTPAQQLLNLLQNPFKSSIVETSLWASLGTSIGFTVVIAIAFSFLRPYNSVVYAPKLKHADDKHAPPPMGKGIFAWFTPLVKTKEQDLVHVIGMDATVFLRFTRMLRNMFLIIALIGCCILIPINLSLGTSQGFDAKTSTIIQMTPINTFGRSNWGLVVCAWLIQIVILGFLWWNYKKILALRRQYYDSPEYQGSLHARTLMLNDIPNDYRSDEGISRLIDHVAPTSSFSRSAIGRNVKDLPELIQEHDKTVRELEKHLARYLKNPDQLPKSRPVCKPSKKDPSYGSFPRGQKVDAIEYLTDRIRNLELEVKEVRLSVDKRNALPYGFASYEEIAEAHSIAFEARNKHPQGASIVLAPRPNDVIWNNMTLSKSTRKWRRVVNNLWITLLTLIWVAPNIGISVFLVNLSNLGLVWKGFNESLAAHTTWWAFVQGVASPGLTSLIYLVLPIIFRRLAIRAGNRSKTARERQVTAKLYTFFVFNNLIVFTFFSVIWTFVSAVVKATGKQTGVWTAIQEADLRTLILNAICNLSPFWVTWLLQRNLGAAVDLAQLWTLVWSFCARKFSSPTPREMIELTAPPPFDYASYYNYFLFYATVTLCYATVQPLVLPAAALYFAIDVYLKKYLLLYIFITKTESGGMFWRTVFNRMVFATILSNLVVFFVLFVRGDKPQHIMAYTVVPLPFIMVGFKIYCRKAFDNKIHYFMTKSAIKDPEAHQKSRFTKGDRLASRYGHPALYKPLITPMVHAKAQNILASIYGGRLTDSNIAGSGDATTISGYSDTYALDPMRADKPGRAVSGKQAIPGFEVVPENKLDFSYFKNRAEFGDEHGQGSIYSRPTDIIDRPGTSNTFRTGYGSEGSSRAGSPAPGIHRKEVPGMPFSDAAGHPYPSPYAPAEGHGDITANRFYHQHNDSAHVPLVHGAADMALENPSGRRQQSPGPRAPGFLGGGPQGYGGLPQQEEEPVQDPSSYDYFRSNRRQNTGW